MKVPTISLKGALLDYAVAATFGEEWDRSTGKCYSTEWEHGGPVLTYLLRHGFVLKRATVPTFGEFRVYRPCHEPTFTAYGETPLVAVMLSYLLFVVGAEIDVPLDVLEGV